MQRVLDPRFLSILVLISVVPVAVAAVEDIAEIIPHNAPIVVYVADAPQFIKSWSSSPLADLWRDPQVQRFFSPLIEETGLESCDEVVHEHTGFRIEEITGMLSGGATLYFENLDIVLEEDATDMDLALVMLIDIGDNHDQVEKLLLTEIELEEEDDGRESVEELREFRGVELHVEQIFDGDELVEENGWAMVDGIVVFASPIASLERSVSGILDGGADDPLRVGASFETISDHTERADAWVYLDIEPWVPLLRDGIDEGLAAMNEAGSPFPLDASKLSDALGIDAMQALFSTVTFDKGALEMDFGLTFAQNQGIMKLLAYGPEEAPRPTFIPVDSDTFSTMFFDFGASWSALVDIVNGINPSLIGLAAMQLQSIAQNAGAELDLRRDLLENLTGEVISIQNLEGVTGETIETIELQQDQVVVLGIRQREGFENAIETLKTIGGQGSQLFSDREFQDHTVYTLNLPQVEGESHQEVAYTITDSHFMLSVGNSSTLEKVLLEGAGSRDSVWKAPKIRAAMSLLPDDAAAVQYYDFAETGGVLFDLIATLDSAASGGEDNPPICDPSSIPDADVVGRYFSAGVSGVWKNGSQILVRSFILPAETDK
jgi:hypothetical protein